MQGWPENSDVRVPATERLSWARRRACLTARNIKFRIDPARRVKPYPSSWFSAAIEEEDGHNESRNRSVDFRADQPC